ncbi:MAG: FAD-dependent thymidylate synthase [Verrucomicrobiae bacterium]|nr:FAD-dependent thymidylate synthase [Verrucomicrobiae bacterium]
MSVPLRFLSAPPVVRLTGAFSNAFDNAVAAARTCYSAKGIVTAEEVAGWPRRDDLARSLYLGGHHTVFQHAHFQFALANVSRQFVWTFLHSHPFYNSEQVSQRYVEVKPDTCAVPPLEGRALEVYRRTTEGQFEAYRELAAALEPPVAEEYFARFKGRAKNPEEKTTRDAIRKRCMEAARYALPIGTFTNLYHTVSGITLMRYHRCCRQMDAPAEQALVVGAMVEELLRVAPGYRAVLEEPIPLEETAEHRFFREAVGAADARAQAQFIHEFDVDLGGRVSLLVDHKVNNEKLLADAVREVLGAPRADLEDDDAIALALDPARNRLLGEAMNLTSLSKVARALFHPAWTFRKKLSHTADSQDQRHRMTPGSRPCLAAYLTRDPDYITPAVVRADAKCRALYERAMARAWEGLTALRAAGAPDEFAAYALPNAVAIRFTESADLMSLRHKCAMRLCYNAQEEIWLAALDEARQVREVNPRIGKFLLPPCGLRDRAGQRPICPEGERYCGIPVWRLNLDDYARLI